MNENQVREYLLGGLGEEDQLQIEQRLLSDEDFYDLLLVVEDDMVDDYALGAVTGPEREQFESHFLSTPERRRKLKLAMMLRELATKRRAGESPRPLLRPPEKPAPPRRYLKAGAAAAAVIVIGFVICLVFIRPYSTNARIEKGMAALNNAYRDGRTVESRISGFDYAPLVRSRGSAQANIDYTAHRRAERILFDEVDTNPGPAAHHAMGRLLLAERKFDRALKEFDKALEQDPNNARLNSDYGAALLEVATDRDSSPDSGKSIEYFSRALAAFEKALQLDGSSLEALFNRALCQQYLTIDEQAEQSWRAYLEREKDSGWADEARRHLRLLEEAKQKKTRGADETLQQFLSAYKAGDNAKAWELASQNREAINGRLVWWQLADSYLTLSVGGQPEAGEFLNALSYLGRLEAERASDRYVGGLARFYATTSDSQRGKLKRAHDLINQGHQVLRLSKGYNKALHLYRQAGDLFDQAGDHWEASFAQQWTGQCYFEMGEIKRSISVLEPLAQRLRGADFLWLYSQSIGSLSNAYSSKNLHSQALEYSSLAIEASEKAGDSYGLQKNLAQLAANYKTVEDYRQCLKHLGHCLELARSSWPGPRQMWRTYDTVAEVLLSMRLYEAAAAYYQEALRLAVEETHEAQMICVSYMNLGMIHGKLQRYDEAKRLIQSGIEVANSFSDDSAGALLGAYGLLLLADVCSQSKDFAEAEGYYDRIIELFDKQDKEDFHAGSYSARKGRLLCYIAQGKDTLAERDLAQVLKLFDTYRLNIVEEEGRNKFFDAQQAIYDVAIDFRFSRQHDPRAAFECSEVSRARSLFDMVKAGARGLDSPKVSQPLTLPEIQSRMSEKTQILQYALLEDKLLTWVISKTSFTVKTQSINSEEFSKEVLDYCDLVSRLPARDSEEINQRSKQLYGRLISPVEPLLDKEKQTFVVPDKVLNYLPFNTLISPVSGHYLISDLSLAFSPSSNIYQACSEGALAKGGRLDEKALVVGDPLFDRKASPSLDVLPESDREAKQVALRYNNSPTLLINKDALEERVRQGIKTCDIIHLASHYIVNEHSPMMSKLVLTKRAAFGGSQQDGVLQADEIIREKSLRARLVVLSGCRTGVEGYYNGEGMIGMSRTFIGVGVPLVVASLWPVESGATAELMIRFHEYRKRKGYTTVEALRRAQIDLMNDAGLRYGQPVYWASFVAVGGYADY